MLEYCGNLKHLPQGGNDLKSAFKENVSTNPIVDEGV